MTVKNSTRRTVHIVGAVLIAAFATLAAGCAESVPSSPAPTETSNSGN